MRLFTKLIVLVVIAALAGPFFIKGPDGRPLWTINDVKASIVGKWLGLKNDLEQGFDSVGVDAMSDDVTVYRWQDESGQWHFAAEPPPGVTADSFVIDPDTNMISLPALPAAAEEVAAEAEGEATEIKTQVPEAYPDAEATKQLIEDVRNLQNVVDERDKRIREIN